ncbi:hypothetical protein ACLI1A_17305 [Flavobacterium sp. RHBU_3]|uniref:hypothetical protein n=1 Tax=Flavobacterium sp. RHBU_3 TaxID=3391184 RepID=UPI0039851575
MKKYSFFILMLFVVILGCSENKKVEQLPQKEATVQDSANTPDNYAAILSQDNIISEFIEIDADKGATVKGKKGTKIYIPENAFEDKDGKVPVGKITFELKEIYSMADMLRGNFTTMSGDKVLQSGGMLYIDATNGSNKLRLRKGKHIDILMPTTKGMTGMTFFKGTRDTINGTIDWNDTTQKIPLIGELEEEIDDFDRIPSLSGSWSYSIRANYSMPHYAAVDIVFDDSQDYLGELAQFGKITLVSKEAKKNITNASSWYNSVERSLVHGEYYMTLHSEDSLVEDRKEIFVPLLKSSEEKQKYEAAYDNAVKREAELAAEQERREKEYLKKIQKTDYVRYYSLTTKTLGLINCDRFLNEKGTIEAGFTAIGQITGFKEIKINLLLKKYNACLPLSGYINVKSASVRLPDEAEAVVVATAYKDGKIYLCISNLTISNNNVVPLHFKETSMDELKNELAQCI